MGKKMIRESTASYEEQLREVPMVCPECKKAEKLQIGEMYEIKMTFADDFDLFGELEN